MRQPHPLYTPDIGTSTNYFAPTHEFLCGLGVGELFLYTLGVIEIRCGEKAEYYTKSTSVIG